MFSKNICYTPVIGFETAGVRNEGEGCWGNCGKWEGRCGYCGNNGYCCRKDWLGCGCDGEMGVEGKGHVCAEKLTTGNISHTYIDIYYTYILYIYIVYIYYIYIYTDYHFQLDKCS